MNLDEITSHIQIRQVLYRYCRGVDRADEEIIKSVYHPDALDEHGTFKGKGEDFATHIVKSLKKTKGIGQHHITNVIVQLDGDAASVESYFIVFHHYPSKEEEKLAVAGGRYLDRFERRKGEWRIVSRKAIMDWSRSELPGEAWEAQQRYPQGQRRKADPSAKLFD